MTDAIAARPATGQLVGALLILAAGLSWSFTGSTLRLAPHLDSWQIMVYRGLGIGCAFAVLIGARNGGLRLRDVLVRDRLTPIVIIAFCLAAMGFIFAMKLTTVANALFLSSCSPLLSAILGYVVLKETLNGRQVAAVALGLVGLAVIVNGGIEAGNIIGNIAAMLSGLGFAVASLCMRMAPRRDFSPAMMWFGFLSALLAALVCVSQGSTLLPQPGEAAIVFAGGFVLMGLGFTLFLRGAPTVPAVGQTVLAQTETVFGPLWVWLIFGETPATSSLVGGAIILAAVVGMAFARAGTPSRG